MSGDSDELRTQGPCFVLFSVGKSGLFPDSPLNTSSTLFSLCLDVCLFLFLCSGSLVSPQNLILGEIQLVEIPERPGPVGRLISHKV